MKATDPYLHFQGNAEEAMNFYKVVFGGQYTIFQRFGDFPGAERMEAAEREKIMHASLQIGATVFIRATDIVPSMRQEILFGNNYHICLQAESEEEADRVFDALSADGLMHMPMNRTFWGAYFGMCRDKYGVQWMINYQAEGQATA